MISKLWVPEEKLNAMPGIGSQENLGDNTIVHLRFFCPVNHWIWLATEYDPGSRTFFGYVQGFEDEWGYFSLDEMEDLSGTIFLDESFQPGPVSGHIYD